MNVDDIANVTDFNIFGFSMYIVTLNNGTVCFVPKDPDNRDYAAVVAWLEANQ